MIITSVTFIICLPSESKAFSYMIQINYFIHIMWFGDVALLGRDTDLTWVDSNICEKHIVCIFRAEETVCALFF